MKFVYAIWLVCSTALFAQKPPLEQKNYLWDQDLNATISDKGSFVLTQTNTGLYIYNTESRQSGFYPKAFNATISPDEKLIAFQKSNDTLAVIRTKTNVLVNIGAAVSYLLFRKSNSILFQQPDGSLHYYQNKSSRPIIREPVNKYLADQNETNIYCSTSDGKMLRYGLKTNSTDTLFHANEISHFELNPIKQEIILRVKSNNNDIIIIHPSNPPIHLSDRLGNNLTITDQPIQVEQPTGKIYFKAAPKKRARHMDVNNDYPGVQVWRYNDPYLYPVLRRMEEETDSSHFCIYNPATNTIIDLGAQQINYLPINPAIENKFIIGLSPVNVFEKYWQPSGRASCFIVNTTTGRQQEVFHQLEGYSSMLTPLQLDPKQQHVLYYDLGTRSYHAYNIATGTATTLATDTHHVLDNQDEDPSSTPVHYGVARWSGDGQYVDVYDKYDIWRLHIEGKHAPRCITREEGRRTNRKFRMVNPGSDRESILLACFDYTTKENGFYQLNIKKNSLYELLMDDHLYYNPGAAAEGKPPIQSRNKKYWLLQRMGTTEYPNYFITDNFKKLNNVTQYAPQEKYNWMTSKIVKVQTANHQAEGLLYLPENFDSTKQYPVIFSLYEKFTDTKNQYLIPKLSNGILNIPWYVSNGYLVFCPDIKYSSNEPGESALRTVKAFRDYFASQTFIDSNAIGIQGHSFGGYETNYIVTHYGGFTAACAVSGAANLLFSFGNIRNAGNAGQNMFERGQYRIRQPLWGIPETYLQNSPVANTGKVSTPLLLVSNQQDNTVAWSHGIEMFTALRRLGKPCWLLQYDHSSHAITGEDAPDFSLRLQQYFDHYLKHQPEPAWMKQETAPKDRSVFPSLK